jgi:hypothetical protein
VAQRTEVQEEMEMARAMRAMGMKTQQTHFQS